MQRSSVGEYFHNIRETVRTILIGMRITLKYCFAKTVTLQYPDRPPDMQPRYRGFHYYEIEKCIACDMCAKACPVDCIYIEKSAARKLDKETGIAVGGAVLRYAIDYSKCLFCSLCVTPCPTKCIHMGNLHDITAYTREDTIVEFTELAKRGLQTPQPLWMELRKPQEWAEKLKRDWVEFAHSDDKLKGNNERRRELMVQTLEGIEAPKKPKPDKAEKPGKIDKPDKPETLGKPEKPAGDAETKKEP